MSVNLNANRGTNASANIVAPSKPITKQSKWTDFFKDKRVLAGLTAATGLTGYLVTSVGSNENIPQPSSSFQSLAMLTTALVGVGVIASKYLNFRQKANFETEVRNSIENALGSSESDESHHNYAKKLNKEFPAFLKVLEKRHNDNPFTQEEISHLLSHFTIGRITNPNHIEMLRNCINTDAPLNLMIKAAVENACKREVENALYKLDMHKFRENEDESVCLKNIMKNPYADAALSNLRLSNETDYGLQVYTRISYDLVIEQIEKLPIEKNYTYLVKQLQNKLKNQQAVEQIEEMAISPFNQEALESISHVLDREMIYSTGRGNLHRDYPDKEKYFEFVENKFINYANDNLSIVLDLLCRLDEMQFLKPEAISLLFTEKFVQHLCDENIAKLKEHLNEKTFLNSMIYNKVRGNCVKVVMHLTDEKDAKSDLVNYFKLIPNVLKNLLEYEEYQQISERAKEPSKKRDPIKLESKEIVKIVSEKSNLAKMVDKQKDQRTEQEKKYDEDLEYCCGPEAVGLKLKDTNALIRLQIIRCLDIDEKIRNSYINMFNAYANYQIGNERRDFFQRFISIYGSEINYFFSMRKECLTYAQNNKEKVSASIKQIKNLDLNQKEREVSEQIITELESHLNEINLNEKQSKVSKQKNIVIENSSESDDDDVNSETEGSNDFALQFSRMLNNNNNNNNNNYT